jgi:tRNA pseudouridine(38-40) synthase
LIKNNEILNNLLFCKDQCWIIKNNTTNISDGKIDKVSKLFCNNYYNFSNFCRFKKTFPPNNPIRRIDNINILMNKNLLQADVIDINILIEAKSFLRNQIRIIVNSIMNYLLSQEDEDILLLEIEKLLNLEKIHLNKVSAPSEGLYLYDIIYPQSAYDFHKANNNKILLEYNSSKDKNKLAYNILN